MTVVTSDTLECTSLVWLASRWVDVVTLAQRDSLVVGGTSASNGDIGTRELVTDALVDTRLESC